jgi:hypothetical protein
VLLDGEELALIAFEAGVVILLESFQGFCRGLEGGLGGLQFLGEVGHGGLELAVLGDELVAVGVPVQGGAGLAIVDLLD